MSRTIGKEISPSVPASCGHGPTEIIWCTAGVSGIEIPAMSPSFGLHTPAAITTASVSMSPPVGADPADAAVLDVQAGDLDVGYDGQRARLHGPLAHDRARAQRVHHADAGLPEGADELVLLDERDLLLHERGSTISASIPHAFALDIRRRSSSIRSSVRAISKPPDCVKTPISWYCSTESRVRSVISREWSVRKMKFDACPVDPPGLGSAALVDLHDVGPAEARQVVHEAVADDAGADDDDLWAGRGRRP